MKIIPHQYLHVIIPVCHANRKANSMLEIFLPKCMECTLSSIQIRKLNGTKLICTTCDFSMQIERS